MLTRLVELAVASVGLSFSLSDDAIRQKARDIIKEKLERDDDNVKSIYTETGGMTVELTKEDQRAMMIASRLIRVDQWDADELEIMRDALTDKAAAREIAKNAINGMPEPLKTEFSGKYPEWSDDQMVEFIVRIISSQVDTSVNDPPPTAPLKRDGPSLDDLKSMQASVETMINDIKDHVNESKKTERFHPQTIQPNVTGFQTVQEDMASGPRIKSFQEIMAEKRAAKGMPPAEEAHHRQQTVNQAELLAARRKRLLEKRPGSGTRIPAEQLTAAIRKKLLEKKREPEMSRSRVWDIQKITPSDRCGISFVWYNCDPSVPIEDQKREMAFIQNNERMPEGELFSNGKVSNVIRRGMGITFQRSLTMEQIKEFLNVDAIKSHGLNAISIYSGDELHMMGFDAEYPMGLYDDSFINEIHLKVTATNFGMSHSDETSQSTV